MDVHSFTAKHNGIAKQLKTKVYVSIAFDPSQTKNPPPSHEFIALWDTGATNTVISERVVNECGLKPIGMTKVHHAGGTDTTEVFLVNIILPNNVGISQLRVSKGVLFDDVEMLIGMDILNRGDFSLTNKDGKTTFSFRMPSVECIDFAKNKPSVVTPSTSTPSPKVGRNTPCPCGSGKKYKRCCGK